MSDCLSFQSVNRTFDFELARAYLKTIIVKIFNLTSDNFISNQYMFSLDKTKITDNIDCYTSSYIDEHIYHIKASKVLIDTASPMIRNHVSKLAVLLKDQIEYVILTHAHFDHIGNLELFEDKTIVASQITQNLLNTSDDDYMLFSLQNLTPPKISSMNLRFRNTLDVNNFLILDTPGHLIGSIVIYDQINKFLFAGDLIFDTYTTGRYDLPGSNKEDLKKSLISLKDLEIKMLLAGHGPVCYDCDVIHKTLQSF